MNGVPNESAAFGIDCARRWFFRRPTDGHDALDGNVVALLHGNECEVELDALRVGCARPGNHTLYRGRCYEDVAVPEVRERARCRVLLRPSTCRARWLP